MVDEFELGNNIRIKAVPEDKDGNPAQPDVKNGTAKIFIEILDADNRDVLQSKTTMDEITTTQYKYDWQTTEGMTEGEYEVEISASTSKNTAINREFIDLSQVV